MDPAEQAVIDLIRAGNVRTAMDTLPDGRGWLRGDLFIKSRKPRNRGSVAFRRIQSSRFKPIVFDRAAKVYRVDEDALKAYLDGRGKRHEANRDAFEYESPDYGW